MLQWSPAAVEVAPERRLAIDLQPLFRFFHGARSAPSRRGSAYFTIFSATCGAGNCFRQVVSNQHGWETHVCHAGDYGFRQPIGQTIMQSVSKMHPNVLWSFMRSPGVASSAVRHFFQFPFGGFSDCLPNFTALRGGEGKSGGFRRRLRHRTASCARTVPCWAGGARVADALRGR